MKELVASLQYYQIPPVLKLRALGCYSKMLLVQSRHFEANEVIELMGHILVPDGAYLQELIFVPEYYF